MGRAQNAVELHRAFEEARREDVEHRQLMLVLRARARLDGARGEALSEHPRLSKRDYLNCK
jgi:hypothetical protein